LLIEHVDQLGFEFHVLVVARQLGFLKVDLRFLDPQAGVLGEVEK
jgi:hypothetical protein